MKTITLAHYYAPMEVQQLADFVGDSLELSRIAQREKPDRIVFAGVRFMAETAKILNPSVEVIIPDMRSTCSLVEQTNIDDLKKWLSSWMIRGDYMRVVHISYINSSAEHKALSDIIVTSANVEDVVRYYAIRKYRILFSPDRNMGMYLKYLHPDWEIQVWSAVCEVHDAFKEQEIDDLFRQWTDGPKFLISHPESPLPILKRSNFVGSTTKMLKWVKEYKGSIGTIFVATERELVDIMKITRPDLDIRLAAAYTGCQCAVCPYMKYNTVASVRAAIDGTGGTRIDYLSPETMKRALVPLERMLEFT